MGIGPLADVGEGVELAEALEVLEFDLDDVGQAAARLQARTDRLILRVALAGIHEFDLDARMRGVEHVDLKLEIRHPRPQHHLDGIGSRELPPAGPLPQRSHPQLSRSHDAASSAQAD